MVIPKTKLARITEIVGESALFLAGVVVGILFSIFGQAGLITADSLLEQLNPIFLFPTMYYIVVIAGMRGISVLLRTVARRVTLLESYFHVGRRPHLARR